MSEQAPNNLPAPEQKAPKAPPSVLTDKDKRELNLKVLTTNTEVMNVVVYEQQRKIAQQFWASGALPATFENVEQVFMAIQIGHSLGLTPYQATNYGYFIKGKYNIYGMNTTLVIRKAGWKIQYVNETKESCSVILTHTKTGEVVEETYTFKDAVDSRFTLDNNNRLKVGWYEGANRKRKLRYGVLAQAIATQIPEVMGDAAAIADYSEDYLDGEQYINVENKTEEVNERKARMQAATDDYQQSVKDSAQPLGDMQPNA